MSGLSLDLKLAVRMMLKHPGLSVVAVFGMAMSMLIGVVLFEILSNLLNPGLPVEDRDRVVSIGYWDAAASLPERNLLHDYGLWRDALATVEPVAAFREVSRNLAVGAGPAEPVRVAEMTASGFRVLRTPPLLGRTLLREDGAEGASRVIVIGRDVWQARFAVDPSIVGRTIHLDAVPHTVVGVMPEGFGFPVSNQFWVPLAADPERIGPGEGPGVNVFGRLAPGVSLEDARAELTAAAQRTASV